METFRYIAGGVLILAGVLAILLPLVAAVAKSRRDEKGGASFVPLLAPGAVIIGYLVLPLPFSHWIWLVVLLDPAVPGFLLTLFGSAKMRDAPAREDLLIRLLGCEEPARALLSQLSRFDFDSEPVATLEAQHLRHALERYLAGSIDAAEIEDWANAIEGRDDIEVSEQPGHSLTEILFELANPSITQPLTRDRAQQLQSVLAMPGTEGKVR